MCSYICLYCKVNTDFFEIPTRWKNVKKKAVPLYWERLNFSVTFLDAYVLFEFFTRKLICLFTKAAFWKFRNIIPIYYWKGFWDVFSFWNLCWEDIPPPFREKVHPIFPKLVPFSIIPFWIFWRSAEKIRLYPYFRREGMDPKSLYHFI